MKKIRAVKNNFDSSDQNGRNSDPERTIVCHGAPGTPMARIAAPGGALDIMMGWADRARGNRKYRRAAAFAMTSVENARMALDDIRAEAELHFVNQSPDWQEGEEGRRYIAILRELCEAINALGGWEPPDLSELK